MDQWFISAVRNNRCKSIDSDLPRLANAALPYGDSSAYSVDQTAPGAPAKINEQNNLLSSALDEDRLFCYNYNVIDYTVIMVRRAYGA